jgi:two-component system, cell cycle sensor histidine kinase and response regulator CckA
MESAIRILLVEDLPTDATLAEREIRRSLPLATFRCVDTQGEFLRELGEFNPDIVVTDYRMPQFDGLTAMRLSLEWNPLVPVIVLTSAINEDTAVECMKSGASDYVIKEHIKRLGQAVVHALEEKKSRAARMQAENELRVRDFAIKTTISAVGFADLTGKITYVNDAFRRLWKYDTDREIIGRYINEFAASPDVPRNVMKALTEGRGFVGEDTALCADGSTFDMQMAVSTITDSAGNPVCLMASFLDVTERRRAQEHQAFILNSVPVILYTAELSQPLDATWISDNVKGVTGFPSEAFISRKGFWRNRIHKDDKARVDLALASLSTGQEISVEYRWQCFDEHYRWFVNRVTSVRRMPDGPTECSGIWYDIHERREAEEALRSSEERYRTLVQTLPDAVTVTNTAGIITYASPAALRLYGDYAAEDVLGLPLFPWIHPDSQQAAERRFNDILSGGVISGEEFVLLRKDGSSFVGEINATRLQDKAGLPIGVILIVRDISERKRAEEALKASERRYQDLTETSPVGIFRTDATGYTTYVNPFWCSLSGLSGEDALGNGWLAAVHPEDREKIAGGWSSAAAEKQSSDAEYRFLRPDGSIVWVMGQAVPDTDARGKIVGYVGTITDITDRKRAEESRRLLSHTMESITEIATITDLENCLTFVNDSFVKTYGYTREEVLGKHIGFLWSPNNPPSLLDEILRASQTGAWKGEILNLTKAGREFPLSLHTSQVKDERGNILGLVGISEDITARKQLEAQLQQAQKMEAVGRLAGGVAHDFNNMIAVILGYANLMETSLNPLDPLRKNVQAIMTAAERSAKLTRQLLAFARRQVITPVPLNLNESIGQLQKMLVRLIGEDIDLQIRPGDSLWNVKIDPTQVDQIMTNLATNARDAIDDVGSITIVTTNVSINDETPGTQADFVPGDYVQVTFSDSGKGMDSETRDRIFEPFFTTKPEGKGTGLGLATVFGIMKQNNGFIRVYSEPGIGTSFTLYFPRFHGTVAAVAENRDDKPLIGSETLLIVEDEDQLLDLSCAALEQYGYTVLRANSPGEAILLCERQASRIDGLITDVILPGMNGKELRDRLAGMIPGLKVLYMSGYTADIVAHRGILEEGTYFLQKPFTPLSLVRKVREVLDKK